MLNILTLKGTMEKIVKTVDSKNGITIFNVYGKITTKDLINAIIEFNKNEPTPNVLFDFTRGDLAELQDYDIQHIARVSINSAEKRLFGKTALVASADLEFGLSKMYESYKEFKNLPFETKVFRDTDKAYQWILS
jgi:hypothetical protein